MTRLSKFPAKITFSFCTLFCLYSPFVFSQQVDTAWVRRYNGPGNGNDKAVAIAVDSSGNVYVTGSSFDSTTGYDYATIKYYPNGDTAWVRRYNSGANWNDFASAIVLSNSGDVYVTGRSNGGFATIKYDPMGNEQWVRQKGGFIFIDEEGAYGMALDKAGNVFATGSIFCGEVDCWGTVKYDSQGNELWFKYNPEGTRAVAITVDTVGNAYVTGYGFGPNLADYITVKYYPNGDTAWARRYNDPPNGNDVARAVAVDIGGNVYVTGSTGAAYSTVKYDSNGNQLWANFYWPTIFAGGDGATALAVDKYGNVYVTGQTGYFEVPAWATVKYDSAGNQLWDRVLDHYSKGNDIEIDEGGNACVTGSNATVKYDSNGNQTWLKNFSGESTALALDANRNVYVTGSVGTDFVTIKYSPLPSIKGDLDLDGVLGPADVVLALNCIFAGEPPPAAPAACDLNCDGEIGPSDAVILLLMVFASATAPC